MKIVRHEDVPVEDFPGGATYRTLAGDDLGSTPLRAGIQLSPPGYATPDHSHPYVEILTVLRGRGEAWCEGRDGPVEIAPGTTLIVPPNRRHGFRVVGAEPLETYGVHASPHRIVELGEEPSGG